jgi:hypothetical protein
VYKINPAFSQPDALQSESATYQAYYAIRSDRALDRNIQSNVYTEFLIGEGGPTEFVRGAALPALTNLTARATIALKRSVGS